MEIGWLEDFLAVLEHGGFSKAADSRHITQSALSRRIRALEEWVETPLFHRTTHSISLTAAGESFRVTAEETLRGLKNGRAEALELAQGGAELLRFASTNALSLHFFPQWLRSVESSLPFHINIQFQANHMEACERMMIQGQIQFLLCHFHPAAQTPLSSSQFRSLHVGNDVLMPVVVPKSLTDPSPKFQLPGEPGNPVPYLSYRPESGMGRIVDAVHKVMPHESWLKPTFLSHLAKLLVTMTLDGRGLAWLPKSLIKDCLETGQLVHAGDSGWDIPIEIHIYRSRARQSAMAERFWSHAGSLAVVDV